MSWTRYNLGSAIVPVYYCSCISSVEIVTGDVPYNPDVLIDINEAIGCGDRQGLVVRRVYGRLLHVEKQPSNVTNDHCYVLHWFLLKQQMSQKKNLSSKLKNRQ